MSQHAEVTLALAGLVGLAPQGTAKHPLVPGEDALRLPALPVDPLVPAPLRLLAEPLHHLPPVARLGPLPPLAAAVERDHRRADALVFPAVAVVLLAVEGAVAQHTVVGDDQRRLRHRRPELR